MYCQYSVNTCTPIYKVYNYKHVYEYNMKLFRKKKIVWTQCFAILRIIWDKKKPRKKSNKQQQIQQHRNTHTTEKSQKLAKISSTFSSC